MKVTAFVGSPRKKYTFEACEQFLQNLKSFGDIDYEIVWLSDYNLQTCRGCKLCCDNGEELCPLKDDRDKLIEKMKYSDGILFAAPNYFFQLSGMMKVFLDRLGFFGHRAQFFGWDFTYYKEQGWFESDYYYEVKLGPIKKMTGILLNRIADRTARSR